MYAKYEENPEQNRILRQLKDMFPSMPHWRLREVCKANNWNLNSCIDQLMSMAVSNATCDFEETTMRRQHQQRSKVVRKDVGKCNSNKDEERIASLIKKGYRVMVLMRGPPGVGKTHLARSLVINSVDLENSGYDVGDFICSSDDYFYNAKGVYKFNSAFLPEAHEFNQQRVRDKTKSGLSPIIVDNTNVQLWEMLPYVKFGVQNNYLIEILEPKTSWRHSTSILAQKNLHGVPKNSIQQMMEKYEKGSVSSLTRMLKNTKYTKTLPQMRSLPPLNTTPINCQLVQTSNDDNTKETPVEKDQPQVWDVVTTAEPKEQRTKFKSNRSPSKSFEQQQSDISTTTRDVYSLLEQKTTNVWKPYESESADFWGIKPQQQLNVPLKSTSGEMSLLDLLREDSGDAKNDLNTKPNNDKNVLNGFQRHSVNCPNENPVFVSLRQIYPNKRLSGLWDLFVKCNGDVDWAVDILLKEDELERIRGDDDSRYQTDDDELFECLCNNIDTESRSSLLEDSTKTNIDNNPNSDDNAKSSLNASDAKPQRQRSRFSRFNQRTNPALLEVKENIENCFVLGDDQYSQHLLKIRNLRSGVNDITVSSNATTESNDNIGNQAENTSIKDEDADDNIENDDDEEDNETDEFNEDMLEMSLGEQLIQQLAETFRNESSLEEQISSTLPPNLKVFMPRSLAKQLYMLWVESVYNHMEEERQKLVREDEDFARLLKNPKYSEFKQSPSNLREILDMEYAWKIYNQDKEEQQQHDIEMEKMHVPNDLASRLTQMKLCEAFPDIPRETLLDMLATNGNDYNATVTVLRSTMQTDDASTTQEQLMECARREQDLVNQQVQNQMDQRQERISNNWDDSEQKSSLSPDEAKRLALREFEESRNLAAHHCQLKAECYQKAKEAIQSGNSGAAIYYSQIANLHKKKIDMYNHRAANCIMDVHKYTQNNPDLLDLHYLHLIEALGCLDLFLDRHITGLRVASRNYKHVFIITGRGKHSAGGVSTIKNKVKARLKERCLRWSEVNPGLLKVKIFSGSRHSKNI
ncbi:NEDD4-binding protein 2 isoform X1 [Lucilia sericata]|uniref:NEDD4-binding protein 2 isoform X1 n=2 Tax=Lucilia sericata TaxID=13632 RepID=UPI0018A880CA|nr:NEDD4-binding protein 2 isoform X1 [Lucilia sericata]